jgi:cytochrome bd-type quinol oxidase subunit 2
MFKTILLIMFFVILILTILAPIWTYWLFSKNNNKK